MNIHAHNTNFEDDLGRRIMLRGVDLGGSSKVPYEPDGATYICTGFFDHRNVSFIGRPFPIEQADEHLERLREWGFNCLRLLVTWEAIEHAGPGMYDEAYLDYICEVVKAAGKHGFNLFIDPHQDVWSRFSGGDGAPGWTLEAIGFDLTHFAETGAAIVHTTHGDPYPKMIWSSNASKLACASMFSLFFGGNDFAPRTQVDGEPAQEYLQKHYIEAIRQLAMRIKDQPNVLGYDTLNEPSQGYIGWQDLNTLGGLLTVGDVPTPFQSMLLGAGYPQDVSVWRLGRTSFKRTGTRRMNEARQSAWRDGYECIWRQNGVWDLDSRGVPQLLRPDHFSLVDGKAVNFTADYYQPFANRFAEAIRREHPQALIFIETDFDASMSKWTESDVGGIVYAPHWYDGYLVAKKVYTPLLGVDTTTRKIALGAPAIRRSFRNQLARHKQTALRDLGGVPVILGEFGIPFDLRDKEAYRTGDFRIQVRALQRSMQAVEDNLLNYALWTYTPDNNNLHGDLWNDEDFSIYSPDQRVDPRDINSGGRALQAVVRPYPVATAGELLEASFNCHRRIFRMRFRSDPASTAPCEVFVPNYQYPHGYSIKVSDGRYEIKPAQQLLLYWPGSERQEHKINIKP
jgi:Glycoside hydrolase family 5 C-terminal domain/Cellulase (glycosyl hydrolase family 5)